MHGGAQGCAGMRSVCTKLQVCTMDTADVHRDAPFGAQGCPRGRQRLTKDAADVHRHAPGVHKACQGMDKDSKSDSA